MLFRDALHQQQQQKVDAPKTAQKANFLENSDILVLSSFLPTKMPMCDAFLFSLHLAIYM